MTKASDLGSVRKTAQSSPIPVNTKEFPRRDVDRARRRISAISALSATGTVFTIPPVLCPMVTSDYPPSVTRVCPYASLTGGTQFVTVYQTFTKPLAEPVTSANASQCRLNLFRFWLVVLVGKGSKQVSISQDGDAARLESGGPNRRSAR